MVDEDRAVKRFAALVETFAQPFITEHLHKTQRESALYAENGLTKAENAHRLAFPEEVIKKHKDRWIPKVQLDAAAAGPAAVDIPISCPRCGHPLTLTSDWDRPGMSHFTTYWCLKCDNRLIRGIIEDEVQVSITTEGELLGDKQFQANLSNGKIFHGGEDSMVNLMFSASPEARAWRQRNVFDNNPPEPKPDPSQREYPRGALILPLLQEVSDDR